MFNDPTLQADLEKTMIRIMNFQTIWPWSDAPPAKAREILKQISR